jgi:uncharacterized protein YndB with AHSA1/START domain
LPEERAVSRAFAAVSMLAAALTCASAADAAVKLAASGFGVHHEAVVNAAPAKVYEALSTQFGSWWSSSHTYSGDAANMSVDARAGGCWCERLRDGGSIEHARVVYAAPGRALRMSGALGPLQAHGVTGSLTWKLTAAGEGTKIELVYSVGGHIDGGFDRIAQPVDAVLGEQLQRLKAFVDTGKAPPAQ